MGSETRLEGRVGFEERERLEATVGFDEGFERTTGFEYITAFEATEDFDAMEDLEWNAGFEDMDFDTTCLGGKEDLERVASLSGFEDMADLEDTEGSACFSTVLE